MDLLFLGRGQLSGKFERDRLRGAAQRGSALFTSPERFRTFRQDSTRRQHRRIHARGKAIIYTHRFGLWRNAFRFPSRLFFVLIRVGLLSRPVEYALGERRRWSRYEILRTGIFLWLSLTEFRSESRHFLID